MTLIAKRITREQFDDALRRYKDLVKTMSDNRNEDENKLAKERQQSSYQYLQKEDKRLFGNETFEELAKFRFKEAPIIKYCQPDPKDQDKQLIIPFTVEDFKKLMAWQLRYRTFSRQMMSTVNGNTEAEVVAMSKAAFELYEKDSADEDAN